MCLSRHSSMLVSLRQSHVEQHVRWRLGVCHDEIKLTTLPPKEEGATEVDNLQGVPPTGGEGETMVTPRQLGW